MTWGELKKRMEQYNVKDETELLVHHVALDRLWWWSEDTLCLDYYGKDVNDQLPLKEVL